MEEWVGGKKVCSKKYYVFLYNFNAWVTIKRSSLCDIAYAFM
jgi:hypothetical protein